MESLCSSYVNYYISSILFPFSFLFYICLLLFYRLIYDPYFCVFTPGKYADAGRIPVQYLHLPSYPVPSLTTSLLWQPIGIPRVVHWLTSTWYLQSRFVLDEPVTSVLGLL